MKEWLLLSSLNRGLSKGKVYEQYISSCGSFLKTTAIKSNGWTPVLLVPRDVSGERCVLMLISHQCGAHHYFCTQKKGKEGAREALYGTELHAGGCPSQWVQPYLQAPLLGSAKVCKLFDPKITISAIFNVLTPLMSWSRLTFFCCKTVWGHCTLLV